MKSKAKWAWAALLVALALAWGVDRGQAALGDILFERTEEVPGPPPAVFPHWIHRIQFRCYVCHPRLFEMKQGANEITMQNIRHGQFCGACHNGRVAFNVEFQSCSRCHKQPEE